MSHAVAHVGRYMCHLMQWQVVWEGTLRVRAQPTTIAEKV